MGINKALYLVIINNEINIITSSQMRTIYDLSVQVVVVRFTIICVYSVDVSLLCVSVHVLCIYHMNDYIILLWELKDQKACMRVLSTTCDDLRLLFQSG